MLGSDSLNSKKLRIWPNLRNTFKNFEKSHVMLKKNLQNFINKYLINDFLKNTVEKNTFIKNTLSKNTAKCILIEFFWQWF